MKHGIEELDRGQLDLMWNFLRFDCGQKSDIPTLKEHLDMLRQAMIQKTGGQEKYKDSKDADFNDLGTIINCIVIETMQEYEDKVARGGDLSSKDVECLKDLAKTKMAILTNEAMEKENYGYSREGDMNNGYSGRGKMYSNGYVGRYSRDSRGRGSDANRDSMGRYSSRGYSYADAKEDMIAELKDLAKKAPDEKTKQEIEHFANEMQSK